MSDSTIIKSFAKINLFLDIIKKREDNYHLIESLFHTVNLYDEIIIKESNCYKISTSGKYAIDDSEDNICTKVFNYFKDNLKLKKNYDIHIKKNIPTGAGLGGGSSNAAYLMKFFNSVIDNKLSDDHLLKIATLFGADVSFFLIGGCCWVSGIGEILESIKNKLPFSIILFYPNIHVSTKEAYSNFDSSMFDKGDFQSFKNMIKSDYSFESVEKSLYNIFEPNVFALKNEVFTAKKSIENILSKNVHMSGSGSSMFTLYKNSVDQDIDYNILCENNNIKNIDFYKLELI